MIQEIPYSILMYSLLLIYLIYFIIRYFKDRHEIIYGYIFILAILMWLGPILNRLLDYYLPVANVLITLKCLVILKIIYQIKNNK